ncbi:MAG TPA: MFS transporter [Pyrinomonadaceae bacterium]|nr:MFS transporter [Pyrinomonadaceae bacterium]
MPDNATTAADKVRTNSDAPTGKIPGYAWYALCLLTLVYILNFLDRTLIYLLFTPIKADMHLSDTQLALLGATSFAIFYTLLGVPFGRMADRVSRKRLIAGGLWPCGLCFRD